MKMPFYFILFALFFYNFTAYGIKTEQDTSNYELSLLRNQLTVIQKENKELKDSLNAIGQRSIANTDSIQCLKKDLEMFIQISDAKNTLFTEEIGKTNANLEITQENTQEKFQHYILYAVICFVIIIICILITNLILRKRMKHGDAAIDKIKEAQTKLQEESLSLDNKLISILEKKDIDYNIQGDHSLAMKVADEVTRIEMNLYRMDKSIKGYKQLSKAVERIKNNFTAQGYEIVDMLGTSFNDGMRINADFIIDETLPVGSRIITSITKPQLNFQGQMIQKAIVTVSQNL